MQVVVFFFTTFLTRTQLSDLYFPAWSIDSSHHAPQHWKQKETNTWLVTSLKFKQDPLVSRLKAGASLPGYDLQILTIEVGASAVEGQAVVSGDVALVCEHMRAPKKGWVQPVEALQPQVLKHSIYQWSHRPHRRFYTADLELFDSQHRCWTSPLQNTGTPNGRNVLALFLLHHGGLFCSTAPVHSSGFVAPPWLPVLHYRKDNHRVHEPQEMH